MPQCWKPRKQTDSHHTTRSWRKPSLVGCWIAAITVAAATASAALGDDMAVLRERILAPLLQPVSVAPALKLADSLQQDGHWKTVDYTDQRRSAWKTMQHLSYVRLLAQAYKAGKATKEQRQQLKDAALRSLDYWLQHDYRNPNWWWNEIGVPSSLMGTLLLLQDDLTAEQLQQGLKIVRRARIGMTGQNLVWVTEVTAQRAILENNVDLVTQAYRRISDEIRIGAGEGIQPDFSFFQHGPCLYSHGYGAGFITDCSQIAAQAVGTRWAFPQDKIELLTHVILDGTQWMTRGNATDFGAEGREITRGGQSTRHLVAAAGSMLKLPTGRESEFRDLIARASGRPAPTLVGNKHFYRADMMTHHRQAFYSSARLFSKGIANTDNPCNSEGLLSHHIADGTHVVMRTGNEYRDIFPVWDWQKIPGTTAEQRPRLEGSPRRNGNRDFVGGVSDGMYGIAAFDFVRDTLSVHKTWFFFDNEIVCLGAGLTCKSEFPVVTTLNQCNKKGEATLSAASGSTSRVSGEMEQANPAWVWHDEVGYIFLDDCRIHVANGAQTGRWYDINHSYSQSPISRDVFRLWIDHGVRPAQSGYAYIVVPGIARDRVAEYTAKHPVRVVRNEAAFQAVWHDAGDVGGAVFYQPGSVTLRPDVTLTVDAACLTLVRRIAEAWHVSVSNPLERPLTITVTLRVDQHDTVHAIQLPDGRDIGKTVTVTF